MSEVVDVERDLHVAIELFRRLERAYDRGAPIITLMVDVKALLDVHDPDRPMQSRYRCGSCRDTGNWSNAVLCPVCEGTSKTPPDEAAGTECKP